MTISNMLRMEASPDEEGRGSTAIVGSTNSLADESLEGGGGDASPVEDSTLGCLELSFF